VNSFTKIIKSRRLKCVRSCIAFFAKCREPSIRTSCSINAERSRSNWMWNSGLHRTWQLVRSLPSSTLSHDTSFCLHPVSDTPSPQAHRTGTSVCLINFIFFVSTSNVNWFEKIGHYTRNKTEEQITNNSNQRTIKIDILHISFNNVLNHKWMPYLSI